MINTPVRVALPNGGLLYCGPLATEVDVIDVLDGNPGSMLVFIR